jgi:hypothetical protein
MNSDELEKVKSKKAAELSKCLFESNSTFTVVGVLFGFGAGKLVL